MEGVYYVKWSMHCDWDADFHSNAEPEDVLFEDGEQFRATSFWLGRVSDPTGADAAA